MTSPINGSSSICRCAAVAGDIGLLTCRSSGRCRASRWVLEGRIMRSCRTFWATRITWRHGFQGRGTSKASRDEMDIKIWASARNLWGRVEPGQGGRAHIWAKWPRRAKRAPNRRRMRRGSKRCRSTNRRSATSSAPAAKVIREIVATTGAKVDIDDEGLIKISSSDLSQIEAARKWIAGIVEEAEVGKIYDGRCQPVDFGAFGTMGGKDGLVRQRNQERALSKRSPRPVRRSESGKGARDRSARQGSPVDARSK